MQTTDRRAPLTLERAQHAAATLSSVIDGVHPRCRSAPAVELARAKLRELLEETGGLYVGPADPPPRMTPEEYAAEIGARLGGISMSEIEGIR